MRTPGINADQPVMWTEGSDPQSHKGLICTNQVAPKLEELVLEEGVGPPAGGSLMLTAATAVCGSSDVTPCSTVDPCQEGSVPLDDKGITSCVLLLSIGAKDQGSASLCWDTLCNK